MEGTSKIIIVEDHQTVRERLAEAVTHTPNVELLGVASNVAEGIALIEETSPDVALVDLGLPDGDGAQIIAYATKRGILSMVVSVFGDEESVLRAIKHGASGYLLKDLETGQVGRALEDLLAGGSPMTPSIARHVLRRLQPNAEPDQVTEERPNLTPRETEIMQFITRGFKFGEIAGYLEISPHTVGNHVRKVYKKLNVCSRSEAVFEAVQWGIVSIKE